MSGSGVGAYPRETFLSSANHQHHVCLGRLTVAESLRNFAVTDVVEWLPCGLSAPLCFDHFRRTRGMQWQPLMPDGSIQTAWIGVEGYLGGLAG